MAIRIVTDSTADLPEEAEQQLGIVVVPLNVIFGEQVYRDGVDITGEEFYRRLQTDPIHPTTSQPSPATFQAVYERLAQEGAEGIISIHISSKLSGTWRSAQLGRDAANVTCPIEVVDSRTVSLALGFCAMRAAEAANQGAPLPDVLAITDYAIHHVWLYDMLDTLEYLRRGGRMGRARALLGSLLSIKPIVTLEDGEVVPAARVRTRARAIEELVNLALSHTNVIRAGVGYTTTPDDAELVRRRLADAFPNAQIIVTRLGPVLGVHVGPGSLGVCVMEGEQKGE